MKILPFLVVFCSCGGHVPAAKVSSRIHQPMLRSVGHKAVGALAPTRLAISAAEFSQLIEEANLVVARALAGMSSAGSATEFGQQVEKLCANVSRVKRVKDVRDAKLNLTFPDQLDPIWFQINTSYNAWAVRIKSKMMQAVTAKEHFVGENSNTLKTLARIDEELGKPYVMPQFP